MGFGVAEGRGSGMVGLGSVGFGSGGLVFLGVEVGVKTFHVGVLVGVLDGVLVGVGVEVWVPVAV